MSMTMLSSQHRQALAGVHAFLGNDYINSFFQKGKKNMRNLVLKNERFLQVFSEFRLLQYLRFHIDRACYIAINFINRDVC